MNRRHFLEFLGSTAALGLGLSAVPAWEYVHGVTGTRRFRALAPSSLDQFVAAPGIDWQIVAKWGDTLNSRGDHFGFNNDFTALTPLGGSALEGILWVNHEQTNPVFVSGARNGSLKSRAQVEMEMKSVGGSLVHIRHEAGAWRMIPDSAYNRRLDALTPIPFAWHEPIDGARTATGTLANCAGARTPWGTVLTCEENYQTHFGEYVYENGLRRMETKWNVEGWQEHFAHSPEHYGWVVEVNPLTGTAEKLVAMGRFSHEGAMVVTAADGRAVAYMGDDAAGEFIYKFIADQPGSLKRGELFVADTVNGRWLSLDRNKDARLARAFASQTEIQIRTREAARVVGGTPQNRPEGIAVHPDTRAIFVSLTNNKNTSDLYGSVLKIEESDPLSTSFFSSTFKTGGEATGFACPDNLVFDARGNLWMTNDISSASIGKKEYAPFGNNGLFVVPASGPRAGQVCQVAVAPIEAELTGPSFSPDGKTLFICVQHPGEESPSETELTSHWPDGGNSIPRPSVVALSGPLIDHPELLA